MKRFESCFLASGLMLSTACGGRSEILGGELTVAGANAAASSGAGGRANEHPSRKAARG
jgi:hypothetical protein